MIRGVAAFDPILEWKAPSPPRVFTEEIGFSTAQCYHIGLNLENKLNSMNFWQFSEKICQACGLKNY